MHVEDYVQSLSVSEAEKNRTRNDLNAFFELLASHGRTFPEECDYEEYKARKSATDKNPKTPTDRIRRIKKYFDQLKKGEAQMTIPETEAITAEDSTVTAEQPETPSTMETEEQKSSRMGAPRKSPEGRTKKITVYITPALEEDLKDLARIDGRTTPDYIFRLVERESRTRANDLRLIREMRQNNP